MILEDVVTGRKTTERLAGVAKYKLTPSFSLQYDHTVEAKPLEDVRFTAILL